MIPTAGLSRTLAILGARAAAGQEAAKFVDAGRVISAQISPGGREIALIRRTDATQQLRAIDLAAKQKRAIHTVRQSQRLDLDWVFASSAHPMEATPPWRGQLAPDLHKCAVSIAGVSGLVELSKTGWRSNGGETRSRRHGRSPQGHLAAQKPAHTLPGNRRLPERSPGGSVLAPSSQVL